MQRAVCTLGLFLFVSYSVAEEKVTYLSCPELDKRFADLVVVIDQSNGTASLQSESAGSGLNFTSPASFGPNEITWRKESPSLNQKFSVNRTSLALVRETYSGTTGKLFSERSSCSLVPAPDGRKI